MLVRVLMGVAATLGVFAGCQDDVHTNFPPGLEPLEDNTVPRPAGRPAEELLLASGGDENKFVHARGYVFAAPGLIWELTKDPEVVASDCDTTRHAATVGVEPEYEFGFQMHYEVDDI